MAAWPVAFERAVKEAARRQFSEGTYSIYLHGHSTGGPFAMMASQRVPNIVGLLGWGSSPFGWMYPIVSRGQVTCGLKVCSPDGAVIREDLGRTPLLRDVAPGETIEADVTVGGELAPGRYQLRYDMVVEGVTWLEFHGSPCLHVLFEVLP